MALSSKQAAATSGGSGSGGPRRQTTVLIGGSNGTACHVAILGDKSNPTNAGHTIRVVTRNSRHFVNSETGAPLPWRCNEQKHLTDLVPSSILPTSWKTHVGAADSVLAYDDVEKTYSGLERAISGLATNDDGGSADVLLLCCPVSAHLPLLRRIARALYRLEADGILALGGQPCSSSRPLLIGTLYGAGGFDWMARIAFASEKPKDGSFSGRWSRPLALFGLKAFPYLCKSTQAGIVTLYGRFPELVCALSPSTPALRAYAKILLERILQCKDTGKRVQFLGLSSPTHLGGDGSAEGVAQLTTTMAATAAAVAVAAKSKKGNKAAAAAASSPSQLNVVPPISATGEVPNDAPVRLAADISVPMADHADPSSSLAFLTCTMNATNQFLHPCILAVLFHDPSNPAASDKDGTIPWDASKKKTPVPRFYADGAADRKVGKLIAAIAGIEFYQVSDAIDTLFAPAGMAPISTLHGGEPVGRFIMTECGNHPRDIGRRSGLTDLAIRKHIAASRGEEGDAEDDEIYPERERSRLLNIKPFLEFSMSYGLSHNSRLGSVLAPAVPVPNDDPTDRTTRHVKPITTTRFFLDDLPHGLCLMLGLATILGFDVERDMPETLACVRRLQRWMGKEYVVPEGSSAKGKAIIETARDMAETSAPQAFGVRTVDGLKRFLAMSVFGEELQRTMEDTLMDSALVSNL